MRRGSLLIVGAVTALAALTILAGCGGQGEVAEAINGGAHAADHLPRDFHLGDAPDGELPGFQDLEVPNPFRNGVRLGRENGPGRGTIATALGVGRTAGHRAQAIGHQLAEDGRLSPEEQKQLTCFLTEKALTGELPRSPEQVAEEVAEYFGQGMAERIPAYKLLRATDDLYQVAEEVGTRNGVSADTALAIACD